MLWPESESVREREEGSGRGEETGKKVMTQGRSMKRQRRKEEEESGVKTEHSIFASFSLKHSA